MDKMYYTLAEVCQLLDLKPYTVRYWQNAFPRLKPKTAPGSIPKYSQKEIDLLTTIKDLVYNKKYTLAGAKAELKQPSPEKPKPLLSINPSRNTNERWQKIRDTLPVMTEKGFDLPVMEIATPPKIVDSQQEKLRRELGEIREMLVKIQSIEEDNAEN